MVRRIAMVALAVVSLLPVRAQTVVEKDGNSAWKKLEFLFGTWTAGAAGKAGQGGFSFEPELNQKIVVRHNFALYDSGERHDDLMVIYLDAPNQTPRAIYFDSEGHVIRYNLDWAAPNHVTFESDISQPGPRYRLSYWLDGDALNGKFEIAPPGADYKNYLSWTSRRN